MNYFQLVVVERVEQNKIVATTLRKIGHIPNHMAHAPMSSSGKGKNGNNDKSEPMDCNTIGSKNRGHGGQNSSKPSGVNSSKNSNQKSEFRGVPASGKTQTGAPPHSGQGVTRKTTNVGAKNSGLSRNPPNSYPPGFKLGPCFNCQGEHRVADCPHPRPPPKNFNQNFPRKASNNINPINETITELDDDEEDDSADFPPMEESINSIGQGDSTLN